ncbi:MAG: 50S ribosomal protein L23 [Candidatus Uhrbacteria bacterium]|nr:50S ribosomal protein L23 [Candidatus Uhrbacteria bacterium]
MNFFDKFKKKNEQTESTGVTKQLVDVAEVKDEKDAVKKPVAKKVETKEKKMVISASARSLNTILEPIVSEKTAQLSDKGVMVFRVHPNTNRVAVKQAFKEMYHVIPESVNIINVRGKRLNFGRVSGKRSDVKKALIKLPNGTTIDVFDGV